MFYVWKYYIMKIQKLSEFQSNPNVQYNFKLSEVLGKQTTNGSGSACSGSELLRPLTYPHFFPQRNTK